MKKTHPNRLGGLIYTKGILTSISHDEGRIKFSASSSPSYQFFIVDHLGNTRVILERLNANTAIVQENHYGAWGDVLEGIGTSGDWKFLYQGKEYVDAFGYNLSDFHSRQFDSYSGRFTQIDGANQFASGYVGMGNMPTVGIDPDGQLFFVPILIGAGIGGLANLGIQALKGNVRDVSSGLKAFGIGAVAGGAAVLAPQLIGQIGGIALTTSTGYVASGVVAGTVSGGVGGSIQGFGNAIAFNNGEGAGRDAVLGLVGGGLSGGLLGGASAWIGGKNFWTGAPRGLGLGAFARPSLNSTVLKNQNWQHLSNGRWFQGDGGDLVFEGVEGISSLAGNKVGDVVARNGGSEATNFLTKAEFLRIENAATRINKPITVVGSRASGKAGAYSDWDYVIEGGLKNSKEWSKIKNSLPGSRSLIDNTLRNIDIHKGPLWPNYPHITIYPR